MVETAVAFPLLLIVALALVQFALFAHAQSVVTGAVQDGARVAAAEDGTLAEGVDRAQTLLSAGLGRNAAEIGITGRVGTDSVTFEAEGRVPFILPWLGETGLPVRALATVSKERFRVGRTN